MKNYKEDFIEYMETKTDLAPSSVRNYGRLVERYLDEYISENLHMPFKSIYETIDVHTLTNLEQDLLEREDLVALNKKEHGKYISTLRKYIEFAKTRY